MINKEIAIAELFCWDGTKEQQFILTKMAQDVADAVEGQYVYIDNNTGLTVNGCLFKKVNIYEVDDEAISKETKNILLKGIKE